MRGFSNQAVRLDVRSLQGTDAALVRVSFLFPPPFPILFSYASFFPPSSSLLSTAVSVLFFLTSTLPCLQGAGAVSFALSLLTTSSHPVIHSNLFEKDPIKGVRFVQAFPYSHSLNQGPDHPSPTSVVLFPCLGYSSRLKMEAERPSERT
jgi:hypothetical protein